MAQRVVVLAVRLRPLKPRKGSQLEQALKQLGDLLDGLARRHEAEARAGARHPNPIEGGGGR